jgi:hypothetical protein
MSLSGLSLICIGLLYLVKPDIFQRWFWKRTAISQTLLTPEQNKVYMRILGALLILVGVALVLTHTP